MSETKVVNLRTEKCDIKCCRTPKNEVLPVPHPSCLGNPFAVQTYGREGCIGKFKTYFYERLEKEPSFVEYVKSLRGKTLGCFCKPLSCHLDIVKEWLDNIP